MYVCTYLMQRMCKQTNKPNMCWLGKKRNKTKWREKHTWTTYRPYYDHHYQISKVKRKSKGKRKKKRKRKRECLRRFEQLQAKQACREALNNFDLFPFVSLSRFLQTGNPSAEDLFQIWHADIRTLSLSPPSLPLPLSA